MQAQKFTTGAVEYPQVFFNPQNSASLLVYINSLEHHIEVNDGFRTGKIRPEGFYWVNEISWGPHNLAIISTGQVEADKSDYLVNSAALGSSRPFNYEKLPFFGENYTWSHDGKRVAFFGNIDYGKGTAHILIYTFATQQQEQIEDIIIQGPTELLWLQDNSFIVYELPDGRDLEDPTIITLFRVSQNSEGAWVKEPYAGTYAPPKISHDRTTIAYPAVTSYVIHNMVNDIRYEVLDLDLVAPHFVYDFVDNSTISFVYQSDNSFYLLLYDFTKHQGTSFKLDFLSAPQLKIQTITVQDDKKILLRFSNDELYAITPPL